MQQLSFCEFFPFEFYLATQLLRRSAIFDHLNSSNWLTVIRYALEVIFRWSALKCGHFGIFCNFLSHSVRSNTGDKGENCNSNLFRSASERSRRRRRSERSWSLQMRQGFRCQGFMQIRHENRVWTPKLIRGGWNLEFKRFIPRHKSCCGWNFECAIWWRVYLVTEAQN